MNAVSPPSVSANGYAGGDGLDQMLRAFFQAQMPTPWPDPPVPPPERPSFVTTLAEPELVVEAPPPRVRLLSPSHLALAASVALMLGGAWILSLGSSPHPEQGQRASTIKATNHEATLLGSRPGHNRRLSDSSPPATENAKTQTTLIVGSSEPVIEVIVGDDLNAFPKPK
jgi:hypothetical protein